MRFSNLKQKAVDFFSEASFVGHIHNEAEYEQALELMDELIEDYDQYLPLIEVLSASIEKWEDGSEQFSEFNKRIEALDDGVAILRTIMDQYQLKADDLKNELGSKSLISMILNGSRNLTKDHIQALSQRFKISPSVFFGGG
ncbi:helix-turn-helix domain-containing protein [Endozoicomonas gorgoniicola]|uniref:Helix-turn-helix domain-containing protein n=1 Tax=Endozoicomonas gorgoniicola TaxID=1234144 RepID=A0ABT3N3P3_9GAMM|nr:helix-turn-helix domain-containing protein [Endozoicomonas gorgoniicola]MCW7556248.1 helix-turn-helix domain-containing protein [Endozoicomonas gorgoniicola]